MECLKLSNKKHLKIGRSGLLLIFLGFAQGWLFIPHKQSERRK
jgi:hypothetical protein